MTTNISAMIETQVSEAVDTGNIGALDYITDDIQAAIDEMVEDGPAFATEAWAEAKRDELRTAIQQARGQIEMDRAAAARRAAYAE
jgi:DNA-binding ferritin-like protein (Dps family)